MATPSVRAPASSIRLPRSRTCSMRTRAIPLGAQCSRQAGAWAPRLSHPRATGPAGFSHRSTYRPGHSRRRESARARRRSELYPLLVASGLREVCVSPRMVYVDSSRPRWVEGFTKNTFTAMVEGAREASLAAGLVGAETWRRAIEGLRRTAEKDGGVCYTVFKA